MLFMFISFRIAVLHLIGFLWSMLAFLLMMTRLLIAGAENAQVYGEIYYITDIELVVIWRLYNENCSYLLFSHRLSY